MGENVFRSSSTHEPTTWQNWPEAKKPCTVQLNGHLSHTVRLKPDVTRILGHVSEAQGLLSRTDNILGPLRLLRKIDIKWTGRAGLGQIGQVGPDRSKLDRLLRKIVTEWRGLGQVGPNWPGGTGKDGQRRIYVKQYRQRRIYVKQYGGKRV